MGLGNVYWYFRKDFILAQTTPILKYEFFLCSF